MGKSFFTFFFVTLFSFSNAQQWEPLWGPMGNDIYSIGAFKGKLFLGSYCGTHFSQDGGSNWKANEIRGGVWDFGVCGNRLIAIPGSGNYASTRGIYTTTDGINWNHWDSITTIDSKNVLVEGAEVFVTDYNNLLHSSDSGLNWREIGEKLPLGYSNGAVKLGDRFFISKSFFKYQEPDAVYSSVDTGKTWKEHKMPFITGWLTKMATDGTNIYLGSCWSGVLVSADEGQNWKVLGEGLPLNAQVEDLKIYGNQIYATTRMGLFRSEIGKFKWSLVGLENMFLTRILFYDQEIFVGTIGNGLFRSSDNGQTWTQVTQGIYPSKKIRVLASSVNELWASGGYWGGLFKSIDDGRNWQQIGDFTFFGLYIDGNNIYGGSSEGNIYASSDGGTNYEIIKIPDANRIDFITGNSAEIYALDKSYRKLFKSTDKGKTWQRIYLLPNSNNATSVFLDNEFIFAGANDGIYRSSDGNTWEKSIVPPECVNVNSFTNIGTQLFCAANGKVYKSLDRGLTWSPSQTNGIPQTMQLEQLTSIRDSLFTIAYSWKYGDELYHGVFVSADGGDNWKEINDGLPVLNVNCIFNFKNRLFGGIDYAGVYRLGPEVILTSSLETNNKDHSFLIFPNPSNGMFGIQVDSTLFGSQVSIYNVNGEKLSNEIISSEYKILNFRARAKGTYLIEVLKNDVRKTQKIILH